MKTVRDVKMALDPDLYVNRLPQMRAERDAKNKPQAKPRRRRNNWSEVFPATKSCR